MEQAAVEEPFPIAEVAGRYLLFDINVVTHVRRSHHIIGVLTGSLPQAPQQNQFLGLPVELLPEEARVLVQKGVAYIVDDVAFHKQRLSSFGEPDRQLYLQSMRSEGRKAALQRAQGKFAKAEKSLARQAATTAARLSTANDAPPADGTTNGDNEISLPNAAEEDSLFGSSRPESPAASIGSSLFSVSKLCVTPTASYPPLRAPPTSADLLLPEVPVSFPLYAHLHEKGYYMTPGLRFGCHYSVYPGDPWRFHAHFIGVGYAWEQEIPLQSLVGGGRLGTGVKKGYLLGGSDSNKEDGPVRCFTLEWGGM